MQFQIVASKFENLPVQPREVDDGREVDNGGEVANGCSSSSSGLDMSCGTPQDSSSKICTPFSSSGPVQRGRNRKKKFAFVAYTKFEFSKSEVNHNS